MTDSDTQSIASATLGGNAGPSDYMHKARKMAKLDAPTTFNLQDSGTARCHILADSNVRILVGVIYLKLKADRKTAPADLDLPASVKKFVYAMTADQNASTITAWMLEDIKNNNNNKLESVLDWLSHGAGNMFFGDAERNGKILHGLEVPIEGGRPTIYAAAIIDAVNGLSIPFGVKAQALQPTRYRDGGEALSSSSAAAYSPEVRFEVPHESSILKRSNSF